MPNIESFLSARLFARPQLVDNTIYLLSNLSGHISLYRMRYGGSVPQPLLPPHIALQNPHLIEGKSFFVFPKINKIVVMIDHNGDENYKPMIIPLNGGFPEPIFQSTFSNSRVFLGDCDINSNYAYFIAARHDISVIETYQANLESGEIRKLAESAWGKYPIAINRSHDMIVLEEPYTVGDSAIYLWSKKQPVEKLILGVEISHRDPVANIPLLGVSFPWFVKNDQAILLITSLFEDNKGLGYLELNDHQDVIPIKITGQKHGGFGELVKLDHMYDNFFTLEYNIDGCSWLYEGIFDLDKLEFNIIHTLCGENPLSDGVLDSFNYDSASDRFILSFSSAISPTQIYTIEGKNRDIVHCHTDETILGIPPESLSPGEDASFVSFDGLRISARLYLPSKATDFREPYPLIYYVHGGPQGQERPDFAWFSMPLIQHLTLNGFAVFVPNVRGSTGYGINYTKQVDKDWGGKDRLDHVHAMQVVLPQDKRLNLSRAGVVGRSYGGYMSLTLASRHPELWSAAVDMFGPYNLLTFCERIPETWKPYYNIALGNPQVPENVKFLKERSPQTYIQNISCPLLVIQGKNDPRVVEKESSDLVNFLRSQGKQVEYLVFENEGHDVLKYENRVKCYNTITEFFINNLLSA